MTDLEKKLKYIVDLLEYSIGDSCPVLPEDQDVLEDEYPVHAAMELAVELMEESRATPADHSAIIRMLEGYAESYEMMARQEKDATVRCSSVAVDIRQNMAKWARDRAQPPQNAADHIEAQSVRDAVIDECCAAIKAADDRSVDTDDYMLDSEDCITLLGLLKSAPPQKPVSDEVKP